MYNPKSSKAEEFIAHEEVLASLEYGEKNKSNVEEIDRILNKAREKKGITHREAMVLLHCLLSGLSDGKHSGTDGGVFQPAV